MQCRLFPAVALCCLVAVPTAARPAPAPADQGKKPGVVVRIQAIDELLANFKYLAAQADQEELPRPEPELVAGAVAPAAGDHIDSGAEMPSRSSPLRITWPTARTRASRASVSPGASGRTIRKVGWCVPRW